MNDTTYVNADFTLPKGLPQPGHKDLAEIFGIPAEGIDKDNEIRPVAGKPGTWRTGVKNCDAIGAQRRHPGAVEASDDFYFK